MQEDTTAHQKEKELLLSAMAKKLSPTAQTNLFLFDDMTKLCKLYLERCGYVVIVPRLDPAIYSIPELVDLFKTCIALKRKQLPPPDKAKDNHMAAVFVDNIMEAYRCSQEAAIKICASIIKTVIAYESYFEFNNPITDLSVFVKANLQWLSKKAFDIMDNESYYVEDPPLAYEEAWDDFVKEYVSINGEESLGFDL